MPIRIIQTGETQNPRTFQDGQNPIQKSWIYNVLETPYCSRATAQNKFDFLKSHIQHGR